MAAPEASNAPEGSGAVSGEAYSNPPDVGPSELAAAPGDTVAAPPRLCRECKQPIEGPYQRQLHAGGCARARKTRLQRLRRWRRRR
jgi:hypothetical protein